MPPLRKIYCCAILLLIAGFVKSQERQKLMYYSVDIQQGDTLITIHLPDVVVYSPLVFKNDKERMAYNKLVRDVKKTLPYAKDVSQSIIESYEMMETMSSSKEKQKFLEDVQKFIMDKYKPKMKKLTRNQGKILVKLIDRECNTSSFEIVKSLLGAFKAGFYNTFAKVFGNDLKAKYDPNGKDKMIERIATQIEQGGEFYY